MIPSRPLLFAEVIGETARITRVSYKKSVLISLLFLTLPIIFFVISLQGLLSSSYTILKNKGILTTGNMEAIRITAIESIAAANPFILLMYGIDNKDIKVSTSTSETVSISYSAHSIREAFREHLNELTPWLIGIIVSFIFLLLAYFGQIAALLDISCRTFEEREITLSKTLRSSMKNLWLLIFQAIVFGLSILIGFGILIGIGAAISGALGALCFFASMFLILYSAIRLMFSQAVLVSEELGPIDAMKRSWHLSEGWFWRIFGYYILISIMLFIISLIANIPFSFAVDGDLVKNFLNGSNIDPKYIFSAVEGFVVVTAIQYLTITVLLAIIQPAFIMTMYYDLRTRKEGPLEYTEGVTAESI